MINCGICDKLTKHREQPVRVVTESREKTYPFRRNANEIKGQGEKKFTDDPGGKGREIVKEVLAHKTCAENFQARSAIL